MAGDRRAARAAAARSRSRRDRLIATLSTVVVLGGVVTLVVTSPGWSEVQRAFFDAGDFADAFGAVLRGFWLDVKVFVVVEVAVLMLGLAIALARTSRNPLLAPLRLVSVVFVDVLRGVPVVLLVYLLGFGVPTLQLRGVPTDPLLLGGIALTLAYSAYVAEVYRAGIRSVDHTQRQGALALGLTEGQAMRFVILPQAVRRVVAPLLNDFVSLQKDVALISLLGPIEAFRVAQIEAASNFIYTPLMAAALCYLVVTVPMARWVDHLQAREDRR